MPANHVYRPLVLKLKSDLTAKEFWWEIRDYCDDNFYRQTLSKLPFAHCDSGVILYTFNDRKFPAAVSFLTTAGIIGLYTTFVFVFSRFFKAILSSNQNSIMFKDLPYVDRVYQLCHDIYLVREALEFKLEEDLFAKLIFLYRSPETMIKYTRPRENFADGAAYPGISSHERLRAHRRTQQS